MGSKTPKTPAAPDPYATAKAQTGSNVATATANSYLGNASEVSPLGKVDYSVSGYKPVFDASTGTTYNVPQFTRKETLSKAQQGLYDQQVQLGRDMNGLAIGQTKRLSDVLNQPVNLDGLPEAPGDQDAYRQRVEAAMGERMNMGLDRDRERLETRLINQGLARGSAAFNGAMDEANRQANDARTQTFLASGQEARAQGEMQATSRERALQERLTTRNQPLNEISALMSGGQVTMPQFSAYRGGQMSETPVGQYVYQSNQIAQDGARAKAQAAASERAGLFNLAGSLLGTGAKMLR